MMVVSGLDEKELSVLMHRQAKTLKVLNYMVIWIVFDTAPSCQINSGASDFVSVGECVHSHRRTVGR